MAESGDGDGDSDSGSDSDNEQAGLGVRLRAPTPVITFVVAAGGQVEFILVVQGFRSFRGHLPKFFHAAQADASPSGWFVPETEGDHQYDCLEKEAYVEPDVQDLEDVVVVFRRCCRGKVVWSGV